MRDIQYAAVSRFHHQRLWNTGSPAFAGDDEGNSSAFSRREAPEVCVSLSLENRGSRECRMRAAPAVSRAKWVEKTHTSIQVQRRAIRHSLRNGFAAYFALSPENRALLSPSPHGIWHIGPVGLSAPPQDLTPTTEASGPHDFTVRFSIVRPARRRPLTENRPANKPHARHRRVHRIPSQRS
jgi:hypothetical protein